MMNRSEFESFLFKAQAHTKKLLIDKGNEYNFAENDRLGTFKRVACFANIDNEEAWFGMAVKHMASIATMCTDLAKYPIPLWREKLNDLIAYSYLLLALKEEEENEKL